MYRKDMMYEVRVTHHFGKGDDYTELVGHFASKGDACKCAEKLQADYKDRTYSVHRIENQVAVFDVGDSSVGMQSYTMLTADLNEEFLEFMKEEKTLNDFRKKLKDLVEEFCAPETRYETWTYDDEVAEREYYERMEKEEGV